MSLHWEKFRGNGFSNILTFASSKIGVVNILNILKLTTINHRQSNQYFHERIWL